MQTGKVSEVNVYLDAAFDTEVTVDPGESLVMWFRANRCYDRVEGLVDAAAPLRQPGEEAGGP